MYEMRENSQGNLQVKNGTGNWLTPVVLNDKNFFRSSKDAADKLETTSGNVSGALAQGKKVKGKDIRRATEAEIRKNLKVKEPEPVIAYRVRNGQVEMRLESGHWGKTVVYNNGLFTVPEIAEELEVSTSHVYNLLRDGDESIQPATAEDMPDEAIRIHIPTDKKVNKQREASIKREKDKKDKDDHRFMGVRWPNGAVDVRFADGHPFMSRDSESDLPPEVKKEVKWLRAM